MNDEEYFNIVSAGLDESRLCMAQFFAALQLAAELESENDVVAAAFDEDGYLRDLFIDPIAPAQYTHTDLEELITTELRNGCIKQRQLMHRVKERYFGADSSWREMKALQDDL